MFLVAKPIDWSFTLKCIGGYIQAALTAMILCIVPGYSDSRTGQTIKQLLGVDPGPLAAGPSVTAAFTTVYQPMGVNAIRAHDRMIYTSPPPAGAAPIDMGLMCPDRRPSPSSRLSHDFSLRDRHFVAIQSGGFEAFLRLGDSAGLVKAPSDRERAYRVTPGVQVLKAGM